MDNLRPERDELDQFRGRQGNKKAAPAAAESAAKPKAPAVAKTGSRAPSPIMVAGLVLLGAAVAYLAWENMQQRETLAHISKNQEEFMGQSKLLVARLEGQLSETGQEIAQSGSTFEQKIAFLDSEVRKLWVVANERNKKAIEENQAATVKLGESLTALEGVTKTLMAEQKSLQALKTSLSEKIDNATAKVEKIEKVGAEVAGLKKSLDSTSQRVSEVGANSVVVLAEVENLKQEQKNLRNLAERLKETDKVLASVDTSRQQMVQRVVELERRLGDLQRNLNQQNSARPVGTP